MTHDIQYKIKLIFFVIYYLHLLVGDQFDVQLVNPFDWYNTCIWHFFLAYWVIDRTFLIPEAIEGTRGITVTHLPDWCSVKPHNIINFGRLELMSICSSQYQVEVIQIWQIFHITVVGISWIPLDAIIGSVTLSNYCEVKPQSIYLMCKFNVKSDQFLHGLVNTFFVRRWEHAIRSVYLTRTTDLIFQPLI